MPAVFQNQPTKCSVLKKKRPNKPNQFDSIPSIWGYCRRKHLIFPSDTQKKLKLHQQVVEKLLETTPILTRMSFPWTDKSSFGHATTILKLTKDASGWQSRSTVGKALLWVRCCSSCAPKPFILTHQWCTDLTPTYYSPRGRNTTCLALPVIPHPWLFPTQSAFWNIIWSPHSISKRGFVFPFAQVPVSYTKIKLYMYISSTLPTLCPVTSHFCLLLHALLKEEGHVEKNWKFRRHVLENRS